MYRLKFLLLILFFSPSIFSKTWPVFDLLTATKEDLSNASQIIIKKDPIYKSKKNYLAYPLSNIIKKLADQSTETLDNSVLVFTAADGYKVTMAYEDALLEKGFIAFKDLSAKKNSWIEFKFGHSKITPAPFYLVWPKSGLDKWRYPSPFQLTSISLQDANSYFSNAAPNSKDSLAIRGFALFSRYCIRCHSVNHTGGNLGPELNLPKNITDFFTDKELTDFILDAPSVNPNAKMPVFNKIISKKHALAIQHYLKSMKILNLEYQK